MAGATSVLTQNAFIIESNQVRRSRRIVSLNVFRSGMWPILVVIIAVGVFYTQTAFENEVVLWHDVSAEIGRSHVIVGPLAAGLAAFLTGRSKRRALSEQVDGAAMPTPWQEFLQIVSAVVLGAIAYIGVAVVGLIQGAMRTEWGRPYGWMIFAGLVAVVFFAIVGAIIGLIWSNRFAPVVATIASVGVVMLLGTGFTGLHKQFSLFDVLNDQWGWVSEWRTERVPLGLYPLIAFMIGLSVLVLCMWWVIRQGRLQAIFGLALALLIVGASGVAIASDDLDRRNFRSDLAQRGKASFTYVCEQGQHVEVCVHPAYRAALDEGMTTADRFYAPVAGLEGVPTTIHQIDSQSQTSAGRAGFSWFGGGGESFQMSMQLRDQLFPSATPANANPNEAQVAIGDWLMSEASGHSLLQSYPTMLGEDHSEIASVIDRFDALSPDEQRAWLEANWSALRAGDLKLEDLP